MGSFDCAAGGPASLGPLGVGSLKTVHMVSLSCLGRVRLMRRCTAHGLTSSVASRLLPLELSATCFLYVFPMDDPGVDDPSVQHAKEHAERPPPGLPSTGIVTTHLVKRVHTSFRPVVVLNDGWLPTAG